MSGDSLVDELSEMPGWAKLTNTAKVSSSELEYQKRGDIWHLVKGLNLYLVRGSFGFIDRTRVLPYLPYLDPR